MQITDTLKTALKTLISSCPRKWAQSLRKAPKYAHLFKAVNEYATDFPELTISARVYWLLNDLTAYPKCSVCKTVELRHVRCHPLRGYESDCCSIKCRVKSQTYKEHREERKKKNLKEFGYETVQQTPAYRQHLKKLLRQRTSEQKAEANLKREKTCLEKYGVPYISQVKEFRDNATMTFKRRSPEEKEKTRRKTNATLIRNYGPDYKSVIYKSFHNVPQIIKSYKRAQTLKDAKILCTQDEFIKKRIARDNIFRFRCLRCNREFESRYANGDIKGCPYCKDETQSINNLEIELHQFISTLTAESVIYNDRKVLAPFELDVIVPAKNIAIEFDGLYWHSDEMKTPRYHLMKTLMCENEGLHLIHIFESEWRQKQDIVKSRLKNIFGIYDKIIYARKCEVRQLSPKDSIEFQDRTHIQGSIGAAVHLGLFYEDKLVSVMTFGKTRFNKNYEWELLRFSSELGCHVVGAAGKLLKHFERNWKPTSIISYADRRWSQGQLYNALGFELLRESPPDYWYFGNNSFVLQSRVKYQKHKLSALLEDFRPELSEVQNMKNNGFKRIFDCGNLVFGKSYV